MRHGIGIVAVSLLASLWAGRVLAEVPNQSPEQLNKNAQNIVMGQVQAIYRSSDRQGDHEHIDSVAEIRVTAVEKGTAFKPGDLVYARFWNRNWVGAGSPPPGSGGHRGVPKKGESARVYLERGEDQGNNALLPNGFQVVPAKGTSAVPK